MSTPSLSYRPACDADLNDLGRMLALAFAGTVEGVVKWQRDMVGLANVRVLDGEDGKTAACLSRIVMAQYFGGCAVPMVGIAGVAVPPEARGQGLGLRLMKEGVKEIAAERYALSALYASTQALYRQVGYEQAGSRFEVHVPLVQIDARETTPRVEALTDADWPAIKECSDRFGRCFDGALDRGAYLWERISTMRDEKHAPFGVRNAAGGLDGYLFMSQRRKVETGRQELHLTDVAFTNEKAGRRLLSFLADFTTMGDEVSFASGAWHPLLGLLAQQRYTFNFKDYWMVRITHLPSAIALRGYSPAVDAEVTIDVVDELVPANQGLWTVRVKDGRGVATPANGAVGAGVRLNIRALASLYSGFASARVGAMLGWCEGHEKALRTLDGVFAGAGGPWATDHF